MTTRQNIEKEAPWTEQLETGYDGSNSHPTDFTIPSCGIEDCDVSLFNLFDKEIVFATKQVNGRNGPIMVKKPVVIFATGERFAVVKKQRPVRDNNQALILPLVSIRRTGIEQTADDYAGRGINQKTGELIIKRRLDSTSDRSYQELLNKLMLKNIDSTVSSRRPQGELKNKPSIRQGMLLDNSIQNNVYEIIAIPQPQFFTATYEVTFWTSYTVHMNYMIETLFSSFLPQGKMFKLTTDKGYWFIAYIEDTFSNKDNIEDFTEEERIIRYSFEVKVKGYILAVNGPSNAVPIKRYISAPQVSFEGLGIDFNNKDGDLVKTETEEKLNPNKMFELTDVEDQQPKTSIEHVTAKNRTNNRTRMTDRNIRKGETVYSPASYEQLFDMLFPSK